MGRGQGALALILALLVTSLYLTARQETGPPPELEAMHSTEAAIAQCLSGIELRLSDRGGTGQASLEAEYMQGGEYTMCGIVSVVEEGVASPVPSSEKLSSDPLMGGQ